MKISWELNDYAHHFMLPFIHPITEKIAFFSSKLFHIEMMNVCVYLMPCDVAWKWKGNVLRNFSFDNILLKNGVESCVSKAHRNQADQPYLIVM